MIETCVSRRFSRRSRPGLREVGAGHAAVVPDQHLQGNPGGGAREQPRGGEEEDDDERVQHGDPVQAIDVNPPWQQGFQTILTSVHRTVKLLVLGGTQFLGRAVVEAALERGDEVTLFNRGETNPELFPEVEKVRGDRAVDPIPSRPLGRGRRHLAATSRRVVRRSAEALRDSVERYLFVSSISAYASFSEGRARTRSAPSWRDMPIDEMLPGYENYGALKALCEDVVTEVYGERALIVRPGLIVGPHDPTGRFTYWPHRIARGGEFVVPAPPEGQVQFVDARDLGAWLVDLCERRESGAFNATHPGISWAELVE